MISKGRNRDSDWLSIVDEEWPLVKEGMRRWMGPENFDETGVQRKGLEQFRAEADSDGNYDKIIRAAFGDR